MPPGKRPSSYSQEDDKMHYPYPQGLWGRKGKPEGKKASGKIQEDDPRFNPQTMGNKKYKEDSSAIREMKRQGKYRMPEVPHGSTKGRMGRNDLGAAIERRISSGKTKRK